MKKSKRKGTLRTCKQCGHVWLDKGKTPIQCPNPPCRTPYWNRSKK